MSLGAAPPVILVLKLAVRIVQGISPCSHVIPLIQWRLVEPVPCNVQAGHWLPRSDSVQLCFQYRVPLQSGEDLPLNDETC